MAGPDVVERSVAPVTRLVFLVYGALGFLAGVPLFLGSGRTDRYFSWTIKPPLTAAFLGAAYWASCALYLLLSRERRWTRARVGIPAGLAFTTLMLVATLVHLDRFHLHSDLRLAQLVAWVWLVVYIAVPPLTLAVLVHQLRLPGADPPRRAPLPRPARVALGAQGAVMLGLGLALVVAPRSTATIWPWTLTPLTARAAGAWLVGLGVVALHTAWENDLGRVAPALVAYSLLGALECIALLRYLGTLDWASAQAWLYLFFVVSVAAVGLFGALAVRGGWARG